MELLELEVSMSSVQQQVLRFSISDVKEVVNLPRHPQQPNWGGGTTATRHTGEEENLPHSGSMSLCSGLGEGSPCNSQRKRNAMWSSGSS